MMLDIVLLRFDAPLVSFGGPVVDNFGVVQPFPARSMLTGLLGNALGFDHREFDRLDKLQARIRYAVRCDRTGMALRDFQTVDLGQDFLDSRSVGWTTWGRVEERAGGSSGETHIRYRDYRADSVHTVALTLDPAEEQPDVDALVQALLEPERPLFLGRKCCLPATPVVLARTSAPSLPAALTALARLPEERSGVSAATSLSAWCLDGETDDRAETGGRLVPVTDERDWANQVHVGQRLFHHFTIHGPEADHER